MQVGFASPPAEPLLSRAAWYTASCGRRRTFQSEADMLAYERGYFAYWRREECMPHPNTPAGTGWIDAEMEDLDKLDRGALQ